MKKNYEESIIYDYRKFAYADSTLPRAGLQIPFYVINRCFIKRDNEESATSFIDQATSFFHRTRRLYRRLYRLLSWTFVVLAIKGTCEIMWYATATLGSLS